MQFPELSVHREYHAENINRVVNDPAVRPWVGGSGYLDLTSVVANPSNVLLMGEGGGLLFHWLEPGYYEVHTQFLPEARGKEAVRAVRDALRFMFTRTDAVEIVTRVPEGNDAALGLVRCIKGDLLFERPNVWLAPNGGLVACKYYAKTLSSWIKDDDGLSAIGDQFHEQLAAAKASAGTAPLHDDDNAHDRYVGAAAEMIAHGQIAKGLAMYNRWAKFAGYQQIVLIATEPVVLDIGDALLAVRGENFDVLLCR